MAVAAMTLASAAGTGLAQAQTNTTLSDRDALVALYNATDGPNWLKQRQLGERQASERVGRSSH